MNTRTQDTTSEINPRSHGANRLNSWKAHGRLYQYKVSGNITCPFPSTGWPSYALTVLFKQATLRNYNFNRALGASSTLLQEAKIVTPVMCYLWKLPVVLKKQWCPFTKRSQQSQSWHTHIGLNLLPAGSSTHLCFGRNALGRQPTPQHQALLPFHLDLCTPQPLPEHT